METSKKFTYYSHVITVKRNNSEFSTQNINSLQITV